jgi:hypothetical protein
MLLCAREGLAAPVSRGKVDYPSSAGRGHLISQESAVPWAMTVAVFLSRATPVVLVRADNHVAQTLIEPAGADVGDITSRLAALLWRNRHS